MGDLVHTFPALSDLLNAYPNAQIDWAVDRSLQEIPAWHSGIKQIWALPMRQFFKEKNLTSAKALWHSLMQIRQQNYDVVLDAQGLLKSALVARFVRGCRSGLDWKSAREPLASYFYEKKWRVEKGEHAVVRLRKLFGLAFDYVPNWKQLDYGLAARFKTAVTSKKLMLLPNTTWPTKLWPIAYWQELAVLLAAQGWSIEIPWGTDAEHIYAKQIAQVSSKVQVLPKLTLTALAEKIASMTAVIAVDTGLLHIAAALNVPAISLYGATDASRTGALGQQQVHLQANFNCSPCLKRKCQFPETQNDWPPCYKTLSVQYVIGQLETLLQEKVTI